MGSNTIFMWGGRGGGLYTCLRVSLLYNNPAKKSVDIAAITVRDRYMGDRRDMSITYHIGGLSSLSYSYSSYLIVSDKLGRTSYIHVCRIVVQLNTLLSDSIKVQNPQCSMTW